MTFWGDEPWMAEHRRLYGPDAVKRRKKQEAADAEAQKARSLHPALRRLFRVSVSSNAANIVGQLENATMALSDPDMPQDAESIDRRYAHLGVCRKTLYVYIAMLEEKAGIKRDRMLGF